MVSVFFVFICFGLLFQTGGFLKSPGFLGSPCMERGLEIHYAGAGLLDGALSWLFSGALPYLNVRPATPIVC